jgi:hypothetical protein
MVRDEAARVAVTTISTMWVTMTVTYTVTRRCQGPAPSNVTQIR